MKYILYQTVNTVNHKIYVGIHKTETPYKFDGYLGCGVKTTDRHTYKFSKTPFEYAVNKYGPDKFIRTTLSVCDTLEEVLELEKLLVDERFILRKDTYNILLGGGIPPNCSKIIHQYSKEGEFVKTWDSITQAAEHYKCSNTAIGKAIYNRTLCKGFLWSENLYSKLELDTFLLKKVSKVTVYLYDKSGNFIRDFESLQDCANFVGHKDNSSVSKAIRCKGILSKEYYVSDYKYEKFPIVSNKQISKVYQYSLTGEFLKEYSSIDANKEFPGIYASARLGTVCKGYLWSFEKHTLIKPTTVSKKRRIAKYDLQDNLIEIYDSVVKAKKACPGSYLAAQGKRKTAGGYVWRYID